MVVHVVPGMLLPANIALDLQDMRICSIKYQIYIYMKFLTKHCMNVTFMVLDLR